MSFIYISGPSGAGKSTICNMLKEHGYEAHDNDENGLTTWYNLETGEDVDWASADRQEDWYKLHASKVNVAAIAELAKGVNDKSVFLCGVSPQHVKQHIDKLIYIDIDEDTMVDRVTNRTNNNYGKAKEELDIMRHWHGKMRDLNIEMGATFIDGTQSPEVILQRIIKETAA